MKKRVLIILLVLGTFGVAVGQHVVSPIKRVLPNHNYTINQLNEFIDSTDPIVKEWTKNFVILAQDGLQKCGEDIFLLQSGNIEEQINFILDNCVLDTITLERNFINSGKTSDGKTIKFVVDPRELVDRVVLTLEYGSCRKPLVKMDCFNLLNLLETKISVFIEKEEIAEPVESVKTTDDDWEKQIDKKIVDQKIIDVMPKTSKDKTWLQKNWGYIAGGLAIIGTSIYLNKDNLFPKTVTVIEPRTMPPGVPSDPPVVEPRTMPPGIPAVTPPTSPTEPTTPVVDPTAPGVPSEPRSMPGSITGMNKKSGIVIFTFGW